MKLDPENFRVDFVYNCIPKSPNPVLNSKQYIHIHYNHDLIKTIDHES